MDELEISGKRYISTRRAGKEHKYHSDYIGQLIRGGKVKGQKVGRSWYVDESSLSSYLGKEVKTPEPIEMLSEVVAPAEARPEEKIDEIVEVEEEKPIRATTWKKIPEVARVESIGETTPVTVLEDVEVETNEQIIKDDTVSVADEVEKENHIAIRNIDKEEKKKNITYVSNDGPVFPVKVRKQKISTPVFAASEIEESVEDAEDSSVVVEETLQSRAVRPLQYGAVAMLGVLAFILVGGMSYLLSYKTTVEGDQMSASVTLTK